MYELRGKDKELYLCERRADAEDRVAEETQRQARLVGFTFHEGKQDEPAASIVSNGLTIESTLPCIGSRLLVLLPLY